VRFEVLTQVTTKILSSERPAASSFRVEDLEGEGSRFLLRKISKYPPDYTTSCPRRGNLQELHYFQST
jgi:hypothetical protein